MNLTFIDNNSAIDTPTRSVIRRQAAKGRNVGRKLDRPSRVKALELQKRARPVAAGTPGEFKDVGHILDCHLRRGLSTKPQIEPVIGDSVSILNLPIEVARDDRFLLAEGEPKVLDHHFTRIHPLTYCHSCCLYEVAPICPKFVKSPGGQPCRPLSLPPIGFHGSGM